MNNAIFSHIVSTEHSSSTAFGSANDYLKELVKQAEESGEEELVLILADFFSMTSLVPFYHACTNKNKYNNKIKPVFGLKIKIQADKSIDFLLDEGDFLLDEKGNLIVENKDSYDFILDGCSLSIDEENNSFTILKGKKVVIDDTNRITDDGKELSSKFEKHSIKKPVFDKDHDAIVIAKGEVGRRNLNDLVSIGHKIELDSDYKKINWTEFKKYSEDLLIISGGKDGAIEKACLNDDLDLAKERISLFETIFKKEDIYLQIKRVENTVDGQIKEEKIIDSFKILSKDLNISLFACNDVRFPKKKNYRDFIIRKKAMEKKEMYDPSDIIDISEEQYLKPTIEMIELFNDLPEAIVNTVKMAEKTDQSNYKDRLYQSYLPNFPIPDRFNNLDGIDQSILDMENGAKKEKEITDFKSSKYLRYLSYKGLEERWPRICKNQNIYVGQIENKTNTLVDQNFIDNLYKKYKDQIDMELEVIHRTGFPGYFLIVHDLVQYCKRDDIPVGPGRGSGAGSMVLYCLEITDIDSIEYNLLFERFLNPERVGEPDIDMDFSPRKRHLIIKYMADTYGIENTAQILTYGTMAAKDVVDNVGRVLGLQPEERNLIKDLISSEPGTKLENELDPETGNEKLLKLRTESPQIDMIFRSALELEGSTKSYGKHAGGVVVSFGEMNQYAGLYQEAKEQGVTEDEDLVDKLDEMEDVTLVPTVQIDKNLCEDVGLIKFDLLGLRNLDVIDDCIKFLQANNEDLKNFTVRDISPHDKKAIDLFKAADTYGIFQFESPQMRRLMKNLIPETFSEIIALVALFRPGPLKSGMTKSFVDRKHGHEKLEYPHADLSELLKETYGTIIYQEQVMSISRILAGFTRGEADTLRKAMGKKIFELMQKMRKLFTIGAGHKYRESILETTSKKWKSSFSNNLLTLDINLSDIKVKFLKDLLVDNFSEEDVDKIKSKFNYYGTFISEKEQVISLLKEYANIDQNEADHLFETLDLMKDSDFLKDFKGRFLENGIDKIVAEGYSKEDAEIIISRILVGCGVFIRFNIIFSTMNEFAAYGFNASHSVAYAMISMQTAFLKAHYPSQYMSALLSNESNLEKLSVTARECRRMGINIMKPDINKSDLGFKALSADKTERNVLYGLGLIKGIAKKAAPLIERRNEFGNIRDIYEFYSIFADFKTTEIVRRQGLVKEQNVKVINKTVLNALLNAGALDTFCPNNDSNYRPTLLATYHHIDNTLTDLRKRLKKNFNEIKKKINSKKEGLDHSKLINKLNDTTITYLEINKEINKNEFILKLEEKLNPSDITSYDLDSIFDIYNKTDILCVSSHEYFNSDDFINNLISLINKTEPDIDKDVLKNSIINMKEKLKGLSINMVINYVSSTTIKIDKGIKTLEREINKKTIKPKEKSKAVENLNNLKSSDEYIFLSFYDFIINNKGIILNDSDSIISMDFIRNAVDKNKQIKYTPVFDIKTELRTTHDGEDIEMVEYEVNGIKNFYVSPTTKETDLVPFLNTKERTIKEYETTGMYQTAHPLMIDAISDQLKSESFNIVPLGSVLPLISMKGNPTKNNPNKHYLDSKIAGTILELNDFRGFNERNNRMETIITLTVDDGTGIVAAKIVAEDLFVSGREDQGIKMLLDIKKKRGDVLLFEGSLTQGNYESEGAIMYVKKLGSANPEIYLPVIAENSLNKVEVVEIKRASIGQINFIKSLLSKNGISIDKIKNDYDVDDLASLSIKDAGELITIYSS